MEGEKQQSIILATDLSEASRPAARWAQQMAALTGAKLVAVHVIETGLKSWLKGLHDLSEDPERVARYQERVADWVADASGERPAQVRVEVASHVSERLREVALQESGSLLVIAMSGKGALAKVAVGSVALELTARPPSPVAIVHPAHVALARGQLEIAAALDFSASDADALRYAAGLAHALGRQLHLLHALEAHEGLFEAEDLPPSLDPTFQRNEVSRRIDETVAAHGEILEGLAFRAHILDGSPGRALAQFAARDNVDLLVLGHHHHRGGAAAYAVSAALRTVQHMSCTVIVVPSADAKV